MSDQDHLPRTAWRQEIHLIRADGELVEAVSESLLQCGLAVLVDTSLVAGEHLEVRAILPNHQEHRLEPISLECRVSYLVELTRPDARFRAGLSVTRVRPRDRERLIAFIRQETRRQQAAQQRKVYQGSE